MHELILSQVLNFFFLKSLLIVQPSHQVAGEEFFFSYIYSFSFLEYITLLYLVKAQVSHTLGCICIGQLLCTQRNFMHEWILSSIAKFLYNDILLNFHNLIHIMIFMIFFRRSSHYILYITKLTKVP